MTDTFLLRHFFLVAVSQSKSQPKTAARPWLRPMKQIVPRGCRLAVKPHPYAHLVPHKSQSVGPKDNYPFGGCLQ